MQHFHDGWSQGAQGEHFFRHFFHGAIQPGLVTALVGNGGKSSAESGKRLRTAQLLDQVDFVGRQNTEFFHLGLESSQFGGIGQATFMQKEPDLFDGVVFSQVDGIVTGKNEFAFFSEHFAQSGAASGDAFKTRGKGFGGVVRGGVGVSVSVHGLSRE